MFKSKKSKAIIIILGIVIIGVVIFIGTHVFLMFRAYTDLYKWDDMSGNNLEWISDDIESRFKLNEAIDEIRYERNSYGRVYTGDLLGRSVNVIFGHYEQPDKSIYFFDSTTKDLLLKGSVSDYCKNEFTVDVIEDNIGIDLKTFDFYTEG